MDKDFELELRREYANLSPSFEALSIWVTSIFNELCHQDDLIFDFKVRQKRIESLLRKVELKNDRGEGFNNQKCVFEKINDLVGSRIIVYLPKKIEEIHQMLLKLDRINIQLITMHIYEKDQDSNKLVNTIQESTKNNNLKLREKINKTGYFGMHYILEPQCEDVFYENSKIGIFNRFELQVRTIMQHTWSEIQHKSIYKSKLQSSDDIATGRQQFAFLAGFINQCDKTLENLAESTLFAAPTPTYDLSEEEKQQIPISDKFIIFQSKISELIKMYEGEEIDFSYFEGMTNKLLKEHKTDIEELTKEADKEEYLYPNSELAELYLKSRNYQKAYELYKILKGEKLPLNLEAKLLLRYAEACEKLKLQQEALDNIELLKKNFESYDPKPEDHTLCSGAAMLPWRLGRYDLSIYFGKKALELLRALYDDSEYLKGIKYRLNLIYYNLENWSSQNNSDFSTLGNLINELAPIYKEVERLLDKIGGLVNASSYDTIAWYQYHIAIRYKQLGKTQSAYDALIKAQEFIGKCMNTWATKESLQERFPRPIWTDHAQKIQQEKNSIENSFASEN